MPSRQQWLFAPVRPLVERLGMEFFRAIPAHPGVYLMRNATGEVVYVGKAKDLRQRLRSYRVANPDLLPRRVLRLLREVARIDFELWRNESAALARETRLLRELKPKYNRAGVWPGRAQFLAWRFVDQHAQFAIYEVPPPGWERFGSLGAYAPRVLGVVLRLLWMALHPEGGFSRLPCGWARGRFAIPVTLDCGERNSEIRLALDHLFWGEPTAFTTWLLASIVSNAPAFERAALLADLEEVSSFAENHRNSQTAAGQLALL